MNCKQSLLLAAMALVASPAMADEVPGAATPPTRAQVKKSVSDARASGQLGIGEAASYPDSPAKSAQGVKLHRKAKKTAPTDPSASASAAK